MPKCLLIKRSYKRIICPIQLLHKFYTFNLSSGELSLTLNALVLRVDLNLYQGQASFVYTNFDIKLKAWQQSETFKT